MPPDGDWLVWLILGGRGAGKTRAGAEWVRALATAEPKPAGPIALVGETFADTREVMIEGVSGLLAIHPSSEPAGMAALAPPAGVAERHGGAGLLGGRPGEPARTAIRRRLGGRARPNGAIPTPAGTCCNSACGWAPHPRQVVTTTPRPIPLLKRLIAAEADGTTVVSRATTARQRA